MVVSAASAAVVVVMGDELRPDEALGFYHFLLFTEDTGRNEDSWSKGFAGEDPSRFQFTGYLPKHFLSDLYSGVLSVRLLIQ